MFKYEWFLYQLKKNKTLKNTGYTASLVVVVVKNLPANAGDIRDTDLIPRSGRSPGGGHGNLLQYSCLEKPHGQRNLESYSPWAHKESDMTEKLSTKKTGYRNEEVGGKLFHILLKNIIFKEK